MVTPATLPAPAQLSDADLLVQVARLAAREREATVALIAHLAELDARRLYLAEGCASLFTYCVQVLHLSEHAAYGRIEAARAVRRCPILLERLGEGSVTLTTVTLLAPHLTADTHRDLLDRARHKSKREVEALVAALRPQPPVPASVRRLSTPRQAPAAPPPPAETSSVSPPGVDPVPSAAPAAPASTPVERPPVVAPLAPERYKVQFTAGAETYAKLKLAQDLLRHQVPDGDVGQVLDRALTVLVDTLRKQKVAATDRPRTARPPGPGSRHIPAAVPTRPAARRPSRTSSSGVGRTTATRPRRSSAPGGRRACGSRRASTSRRAGRSPSGELGPDRVGPRPPARRSARGQPTSGPALDPRGARPERRVVNGRNLGTALPLSPPTTAACRPGRA